MRTMKERHQFNKRGARRRKAGSMSGKLERYITEQPPTGFCLLDSKIAYELRRDIWAVVFNARGDFVRVRF